MGIKPKFILLCIALLLLAIALWLVPIIFSITPWLAFLFPLSGKILLFYLASYLDEATGKGKLKKWNIAFLFLFILYAFLFFFGPTEYHSIIFR